MMVVAELQNCKSRTLAMMQILETWLHRRLIHVSRFTAITGLDRKSLLQRVRYRYRSDDILCDDHFHKFAQMQLTSKLAPSKSETVRLNGFLAFFVVAVPTGSLLVFQAPQNCICMTSDDGLDLFSLPAQAMLQDVAKFHHCSLVVMQCLVVYECCRLPPFTKRLLAAGSSCICNQPVVGNSYCGSTLR